MRGLRLIIKLVANDYKIDDGKTILESTLDVTDKLTDFAKIAGLGENLAYMARFFLKEFYLDFDEARSDEPAVDYSETDIEFNLVWVSSMKNWAEEHGTD